MGDIMECTIELDERELKHWVVDVVLGDTSFIITKHNTPENIFNALVFIKLSYAPNLNVNDNLAGSYLENPMRLLQLVLSLSDWRKEVKTLNEKLVNAQGRLNEKLAMAEEYQDLIEKFT